MSRSTAKLTRRDSSSQKLLAPQTPSPKSTKTTVPSRRTPSPKSTKSAAPSRIIRGDDSWQISVRKKSSGSAFTTHPDDELSLVPAQLRPEKLKRAAHFLSAAQPLRTPNRPTALELLALEYSDEESKPEPLFTRRKTISTNEPVTPRLTRQLVQQHLHSDHFHFDRLHSKESSNDEYVSEPESEPEAPEEKERRIKKSRRIGLILEIVDLDPEIETIDIPMADLLHPESALAMTNHRREAVRLAKDQEASVIEKCKRSGQEMPAYSFNELIGKGSYGRVYKGRQTTTNKVVAIKVIDIDEADFHSVFEQKDEQIKDFNREIRILKQAQDSGAVNLNQMIEALPVHSQLWLVCEYCPGGSVKTLMRATNDRLAERYIRVVARELAKALACLHGAGIMHRDVKAANVLIHEEGGLQLCDFGVATVVDTKSDKRKTFIGTIHWMPPELFVDNPAYSDEVDVWEFGCTLFETATGKPPHSDLRERQHLASRMRRLKEPISLPEDETFSDGLRSLVTYTLSPDARTRPSMEAVKEHEYLHNTEEEYPTTILSELVKVYYEWLYTGGQRISLFMPGGAVVSGAPGSITTPTDEWNFSTTEVFQKRVSAIMDIPDFSQISTVEDDGGEATPRGSKDSGIASTSLGEMTGVQRANFEARVQRGEGLVSIFDPAKPIYEYKTKTDFRAIEERRVSDLPFRAMAEDRPSSIASNVIDLGDFDSEDYAIAAPMKEETTIQLADAATIRAKRSDSKGPTRDTSATRTASAEGDISGTIQSDRTSTHDFSFPPKEWTTSDETSSRGNEATKNELTPIKDDGRKTMDWTFASAISASPTYDRPQATATQSKASKHATLEWSFTNAMAEIGSDEDAPRTSVRTTPKRPAAPSRTMTQPVTSNEVHTAEELPRPSTAMSETYSESSMSSADFDPFALENNQSLPAPVSQAMDNMGVGSYYSNSQGAGPEYVVPYSSTIAGAGPYMMGPPARIGEAGFPGPQAGALPSALKNGRGKQKKDSVGSNSTGRPRIELPEAIPPSQEAMSADAAPEVVENELSRLLGGLQASLAGATQALKYMKPRRGRKQRPSSSEWEDE